MAETTDGEEVQKDTTTNIQKPKKIDELKNKEESSTSVNSPFNTNKAPSTVVSDKVERSPTPQTKRPRKKRKTFSCDTCRKFKTRCDFEPLSGKCHRCNVLQIECSLTKEREQDIINSVDGASSAISLNSINSSLTSLSKLDGKSQTQLNSKLLVKQTDFEGHSNPLTRNLNERLFRLEENFNSLNSKIDLILLLMQGSSSAASNANDLLANSSTFNHHTYDIGDYPMESVENDDEPTNEVGKQQKSEPLEREASSNSEVIMSATPILTSRDNTDSFSHGKVMFSEGFKLTECPLKIINDIDERLFPLTATSRKEAIAREQRPSAVARVNFLQFYEKHKSLCHKLSKEFLVRSHFWIIPGGVKEIDVEYVHKHLFITSVFTIIAMSSADNDKYTDEQETLYPLVERLVTNTLTMFEKLTAHDIEALLYCCMFHISKKAKRHRQLKFDSLVLSNFALFSLLNNIDFYKIKERVLIKEEYNAVDLYHLRILNSLTACHLEYSIMHGTITPQDNMIKDLNNLIAKFPQANFGDDIKISEINLSDITISVFMDFKSYFINFKSNYLKNVRTIPESEVLQRELLIFPELDYWLKNWEELLSKDGGGVLLFTFDFYHIMICRSFITEFLIDMKKYPKLLNSVLYTMKEHAFSLLKGFLRLPPSLIRGAPILTTNELIYACLTLGDFLHWFDGSERQQILSICTRVYWHLNTIGEKLNEVTENVGKVIKSIITSSKHRINMGPFPTPIITVPRGGDISPVALNFPQSTAMSDDVDLMSSETKAIEKTRGIVLQAEPSPTVSTANSQRTVSRSNSTGNPNSLKFPDVDQFNSFEDFFQDFFENLKPNTKRMFSNTDK